MIRPLKDRVLVRPIVEQRGIIITTDDIPVWGEVVAVGPEVKGIKVGDRVRLKKYGLDEIELDGEKYLFGSEDFILGVEIDEK